MGGVGWMAGLHLYLFHIRYDSGVVPDVFMRFFNTLELPALCTVFFQQCEFELRLRTLQGGSGAAVSHPHSWLLSHCPLRTSRVVVGGVTFWMD